MSGVVKATWVLLGFCVACIVAGVAILKWGWR